MPRWIYGITTVPERRETYFPKTLLQLEKAGFPKPIVFHDGECRVGDYPNLMVSSRSARLGAFGNWITALWELYIRDPKADRYAIFQDDILCPVNLRSYLDTQELREDTYWNLFTFLPENEKIIAGKPPGWYESDQYGRGALGLVLGRKAVVQLFSSRCTAEKPLHATRGKTKVDGAVVTALSPVHKQPGGIFRELIHNPSLLQHAGDVSSIGHHHQPKAHSFPGEDFDCLTLLPKPEEKPEEKRGEEAVGAVGEY